MSTGSLREEILEIAGLRTLVSGTSEAQAPLVMLLHGYRMRPEDLAPFGRSLKLPALFLFPEGPCAARPSGCAWWPPSAASADAPSLGPRDLVDRRPGGLETARARLEAWVGACIAQFATRQVIIGGFSQGGMLACDWLLHSTARVAALVMLSASRINGQEWSAHKDRLRDLPVLVTHGRADADLSFSAGEGLRDFLLEADAQVSWFAFEGGHELPLPVWRALRGFLKPLLD